MKIMASGLIMSWQIDGGKVETVTDFIFLGYKIATDNESAEKHIFQSPFFRYRVYLEYR